MPLQTPRVDENADHSHHCLSDLLRTKDEIHLEIYAMTSDKPQGYAHLTAQIAAAEAERDEKDKQLASCYDRMEKAEVQRDKARNDALDLAAQLCDSEASCEGIAQKCAAAIRAMKECGK